MTYRSIDPTPFRARYQGAQTKPGKRPELKWLKISQLRIDPRYQRDIGKRGTQNILEIAHHFRWSKFSIVVVAPIGKALYAIVDGQHHTTSAALRDIDEVPCVIIDADELEQADSFVAINANVTAMSPLQIHAARLAAGNVAASQLTEVCAEAGVTICRYPVPANKIKPGETLAVALLQVALDKYGRDVLVSALSCITQTRKGNPGMIRKQVVEALCAALDGERHWLADRKRLIFAMQTFDFAAQFTGASTRSIETGANVSAILHGAIAAHLSRKPVSTGKPPVDVKRVAANAAPAPAAPPAPRRPAAADGMSLAIGRDFAENYGERIKISPRASLLLMALSRAKGQPVGDEFLIAKIWTVRPANAPQLLEQLVSDLTCLKKLCIEVRTLRGVGRQLVEIDP